MNTKKWFAISSAVAFAAMISFFQIDSAFADEKKLNTLFTVAGILLTLTSAGIMYFKVWKNSNTDKFFPDGK
jgi:hypothetical protein